MLASDMHYLSGNGPLRSLTSPSRAAAAVRTDEHGRKASLTVIGISLLAFYGAVTTSYQAITPAPHANPSPGPHVALIDAPATLPMLPGNFVARRPIITRTVITRTVITRPEIITREAADLNAMDDLFRNVAFDLSAIRSADMLVPRLFLTSLPGGFGRSMPVAVRKNHFLRIVLPIVLAVNEEIAAERNRVLILKAQMDSGDVLRGEDAEWLATLASRYKLDPVLGARNIDALLTRVDEISVSVALAQAIEESGWGRSRFARNGNALFGQRTWVAGGGIVPTGRGANQTFEVKAFPTLLDSVRRYARNLNTHGAYANFRTLRREFRRDGRPLDGHELAQGLLSYSERGADYVANLRNLIRTNRLGELERAVLLDAGKEA